MARAKLNRRGFIGAAVASFAATACARSEPRLAMAALPVAETVILPVSSERSTQLTLWAPTRPSALALFSHGYNSSPERYGRLAALLNGAGIAVASPLHIDSLHAPSEGQVDPRTAFETRIADIAATSAYATERFAGLPVLAAGHSFGSLIAMCAAGALEAVTHFRLPSVRAVLAFSTPGKVQGLVGPDAFSSLAAPLMLVTGTDDTVPGFVSDPIDHLFPAETAGADSYAFVVDGADHKLVDDEPALGRVWPAVELFVRAELFNEESARNALNAWQAGEGVRFLVRKSGM